MLKSSCILILNLLVFVIFRNELALTQMGTIFLVYIDKNLEESTTVCSLRSLRTLARSQLLTMVLEAVM